MNHRQIAGIERLAVIGAGSKGWQIAAQAALAQYRTILEDVLPASLRRAEAGVRGCLDQLLVLEAISADEARAALRRLEYSSSVEQAARQAELIIEAVPDEMESKLEIFALLDRMAKPRAILASTSSRLRVAEIASITCRANRILGLRFSPPAGSFAKKLALLEIVRIPETDDETMAAGAELGRRLAETVLVTAEAAAG